MNILGVQIRLNPEIMFAERFQFERSLPSYNIDWYNIFDNVLPSVESYDAVLIGGSGSVSLSKKDEHADYTFKIISSLLDTVGDKRVVGVCMGYHLIAKYYGSNIIFNPSNAETGTIELKHNLDGLPNPLLVQCGHNDSLDRLPSGATLLATGEQYKLQMFRYGNMYAIQSHPEQTRIDLQQRLQHFPHYEHALSHLKESPDAHLLLEYCFR